VPSWNIFFKKNQKQSGRTAVDDKNPVGVDSFRGFATDIGCAAFTISRLITGKEFLILVSDR
jgi:hypothetical protein